MSTQFRTDFDGMWMEGDYSYGHPFYGIETDVQTRSVMNIYRVENADGYGPFHDESFTNSEDYSEFTRHSRRFPVPWNDKKILSNIKKIEKEDGIFEDFECYHCGCSSMRQLEDWFGPFWDILYKHGFKVVIYTFLRDDVIVGETQVLFKKHLFQTVRDLRWDTRYDNIRPII